MGHAEHFLSRLDRFAGSEVELALGLYRDPDLLRAVLAAVRLPEGAERVAISLDDPEQGPYLVVTREGHFVTCLARGMAAGSLPVVARGQLDALSHKFEGLRERLALAQHVTGSTDRACAVLLRRLLTAADRVSREDFLAISAWEPLLAKTFLDLYLAMVPDLLDAAHVLRNVAVPRRKREELLHDYWNLLHAAGHFALLGTMGGDAEHFHEVTRERLEARSAFGFALTSTGVVRFLMQGAWATGRLGRQILPAYKQSLANDVSFIDWLDTVYALVALGRRSSGLRAEITKALHSSHGSAHNEHAKRLREALGPNLTVIAAAAAECMSMDAGEADRFLLNAGGQLLGAPQGEIPGEIPAEVLRAVALGGYSDVLSDVKRSMLVLLFIAASARGAPEQFYLPREIAKEWHTPWEPALTERVLEPMRTLERANRTPVVREKKPGPNQACSCGSGRKYKKCCGAPGP